MASWKCFLKIVLKILHIIGKLTGGYLPLNLKDTCGEEIHSLSALHSYKGFSTMHIAHQRSVLYMVPTVRSGNEHIDQALLSLS